MGLLDFLKFAKPTPAEKQSLTAIQRVQPWTSQLDMNWNTPRQNLRQLYLDDEICAATDTRKDAATSTPWLITGGEKKVNLDTWELFKPLIPKILDSLWWAVPYGYSVVQIVWKEEGGKLIPYLVLDQPFESFKLNGDQKLVFTSDTSKLAKENKFFVCIRNPSFNSPHGEALYQRLYGAYWYRLNAWEFWIQYLESWGKPFMHASSESNDSKTIEFLKTLIGVKRPRGVITGKDVDVKVIESSVSSGTSFKDFEQALSQRIQRLILGQTLTSGAGDVGSQALGTVHNQVRDDKRVADCKLMEKTVQEIINAYFKLNEIPGEVPIFEFQQTQSLNKDLAERDNLLLQQGVKHTDKYYEENYDFDPEDFELFDPQPIQTGQPFAASQVKEKFAVKTEVTDAQIQTENEALKDASPLFTEEELSIAIKKSKTKNDLIKNLKMLLGKDPSKFEDDVTKALLMANVQGFTHGTEGN